MTSFLKVCERFARVLVNFAGNHPVGVIIVATALVGAPALVAVGSLVGHDWYPTGDVSHTELMLRSIPRDFPLIGVAARVGDDLNNQGSTPGASMAYILFPIYAVFLRSSVGMVVAVLTIHLVAVGSSIYVAGRLGGRWAAWSLVVTMALVIRALAPRFFLEPWNVWIPLFAFAVFIVLIWGVVLGRHGYLPVAVGVGMHCVQTHISYVPLITGVLAMVVALILVRQWQSRSSTARVRTFTPLVISAAVFIVMWIPPIIEQLRPGAGNLARLWRHFSDPKEDTVGLNAAIKAMAGELNLAGPFITGPGRAPYDSPNVWGFLGFIVVVLTGVVIAWHRKDRRIRALQGVLAFSTTVGLVATARVFGQFYDYVIRWMWVLALFWLAVSIWAIIESVSGTALRRRLVAMISAVAIGAASWGTVASVGAQPPYVNDSRLVGGLAPLFEEMVDPDVDYLLRWHDPASLGGTGFGLLLEMEKRGVNLYVDSWAGAAARPHRVRTVEETELVLCLVVGPENIDRFGERPFVSELAQFDPRTEEERQESDRLRRKIEKFLHSTNQNDLLALLDSQYGHTQILLSDDTDPELFEMLDRYSEIRLPGALFAAPQGSLCIP